jgi:peptidoglycan/LPS O-acetylase OafA/YrhL
MGRDGLTGIAAQAAPPSPGAGKPYFPVLDGLRAISIGLVIFSHSVIYHEQPDSVVVTAGLHSGNVGVSLFFVISGFIITHLLLREEATRGDIRLGRFYIRRGLRLLPACYLYIMIIYLLGRQGVVHLAPNYDYLASLFYVRNLIGRTHETGHLWSLSLEEQFYLFWPGLLALLPAICRLPGTIALIASVWCWRFYLVFANRISDGALYIRTDVRIDTILFGCALALMLPPGGSGRIARLLAGRWMLSVYLFGLVGWLLALQAIPYGRAFATGIMSIFLCGIVNWFLHNHATGLGQLFSTRPFQFVGRLSYSLYLWQQLFLGPAGDPIYALRGFPIGLICIVLAALASYFFIERPFLLLKDRKFSALSGNRQLLASKTGGD